MAAPAYETWLVYVAGQVADMPSRRQVSSPTQKVHSPTGQAADSKVKVVDSNGQLAPNSYLRKSV